MAPTRQKCHPAAIKAKVALEAAKQTRTPAELSKAFQVHPVQISQWKKQLLDGAESLFVDGRRREHDQSEALQVELYQQIGRLHMELEWLKKSCPRRLTSSGPWSNPSILTCASGGNTNCCASRSTYY